MFFKMKIDLNSRENEKDELDTRAFAAVFKVTFRLKGMCQMHANMLLRANITSIFRVDNCHYHVCRMQFFTFSPINNLSILR